MILVSLEALSKKPPLQACKGKWWEYVTSVDDYLPLAEAGADELFCGYVPGSWQARYPNAPMNRREVKYANVQIGAESERLILKSMMENVGVPVTLALNSSFYEPAVYLFLAEYIAHNAARGFGRYIIADPGLILYLSEEGITGQIHLAVSGEYGQWNRYSIQRMAAFGADRIIFHRQMSLCEMRRCVEDSQEEFPCMEYEALFLNEKCHFTGAYCSTIHCDEMAPFCRVPYKAVGACADEACKNNPDRDGVGAGGCAFCSLWQLREAGVSYLKIVGRGNRSDCILRDVRTANAARTILVSSGNEREYLAEMKKAVFQKGCSGNCYYLFDF